jgi:hypothetical protein
MRPDPGRAAQEAVIVQMPIDRRTATMAKLRQRGRWMVWQQLDERGIEHPVEQAEFLLRRLYPEMPKPWFADVLAKLSAKYAAGEWRGFERPADSMETT